MRRWLALAPFVTLSALSSLAFAWTQGADFGATVHGHGFTRTEVESSDCILRYKLFFNAPADGYSSRAKTRNVYLFRSRIDFASGKSAPVPVFANRGPGARVYENQFDSSGDGCWVKDKQQLRGVKVEGCRGDGCTPEALK